MWTCSFRLTGLESHLKKHRKKTRRHPQHLAQAIAAAAVHLGVVAILAIVAVGAYFVPPSGQIRITSVTAPTGNQRVVSTTQEQSVVVNGMVGDPSVSRVFLVVNGVRRPVSVNHGTFQSRVGLIPGRNLIQASLDRHDRGLRGTSQAVRLTAAIPPYDVWSELTWEGLGDIDLHLVQPDGEECSFANKTTHAGATLDYDNTVQDGPEDIRVANALPGAYQLKVVYFAAPDSPPRKVPWKVTLRLRNGPVPQTYAGVLESVGEAQTVSEFTVR